MQDKILVDKLVEERTGNIDEVNIAGMALFERGNKCKSSCAIYVALIVIIFTISIGIGTYFIYYKHMNHDKISTSKYDYVYQTSN